MAFPFQRYEEYRTSHTLVHLCQQVGGSLSRRSSTRAELQFHSGEVHMLIVAATAELTRRASVRKLMTSLDHVREVDRLLRLMRRRGWGSRAYVTAGLEIAERLCEQVAHRIERHRKRR
jgi:hypothetical protein